MFGHDNLIHVLKNMINNKHMPNILISGPCMSGKTIIVNSLLKEIYKNEISKILEILIINNNSINIIKEKYSKQINDINIGTVNWNIILLDDAHLLSFDSQIAISHIIETYYKYIRFIFTTNNINKIVNSLKSRCNVLNINLLSINKRKEYINEICKLENIQIDILHVVNKSDNNLNRLLLELVKYSDLSKYCNYKFVKHINLDKLIEMIKNNDYNNLIEYIKNTSKYPILNQIEYILEYILNLDITEYKKLNNKKVTNVHHIIILQNNEFVQYSNLIFFIIIIYNED